MLREQNNILEPKAARGVPHAAPWGRMLCGSPSPMGGISDSPRAPGTWERGSRQKAEGDHRQTVLPTAEFCLHLPSSSFSLLICSSWFPASKMQKWAPHFQCDPVSFYIRESFAGYPGNLAATYCIVFIGSYGSNPWQLTLNEPWEPKLKVNLDVDSHIFSVSVIHTSIWWITAVKTSPVSKLLSFLSIPPRVLFSINHQLGLIFFLFWITFTYQSHNHWSKRSPHHSTVNRLQ